MPNTNLLDDARALVESRLAELDAERKKLERVLAEMGGKITRRGPGRPRGSRTSKPRQRKPRQQRKRRSGTRADGAVKLIEANPGITASEIATQMKIKPNYLYRVLGGLQKEKRVRKRGRKYYPAG